ncbi:MAG: preprotein translocase subunit YajC [Gemmatimonadota bacterium]|nr:preprotein translocase subunit YajC [Gemmatimonadota bacterium]
MTPHLIGLLQETATPQGGNPFGMLFMFAAIFAIFYFLLIRPQRQQQKAHEQMVSDLSKGDEVITLGGVVGRIVHLTSDRVTLRTAGDTRIEIERSKVGRRLGSGGSGS